MKIIVHETKPFAIAELNDVSFIISETQDALDLMAESGELNCNRIIVREANIHPGFFDLSTGMAGDILQKFSNYRARLAIVGDFSKYESKSLRDFIRESNKGNSIFFVENINDAVNMLIRK